MALKFEEAEIAYLERQEGTPTEIEYPKDLPNTIFNQPKIFQDTRQNNYFGYFQPMIAVPDYETGTWTAKENYMPKVENSNKLVGENFIADSSGVYNLKKGTQGNQVSNVTVKIKAIEKHWNGKKIKEKFRIEVDCAGKRKTLKVPFDKFKDLFEIIRKEFPSAYISSADHNSKDEYLTEIFNRDSETAEVEYYSELMGWVENFENLPPKFYVGTDKFYEGMEISIPNVSYADRTEIFLNGFGFRQIGHENNVIEILWIVAHIAPELFWLRKYGVDFRSVIFVKGKTNLFKTTVVTLLSNIFAKNRNKAFARLTSTKAYIQEFMTKSRDVVVLLDDFSNTVGANNKQAIDNAENIIRATGDGMFAGKMNIKDFSEGRSDSVQCVTVLTGEDELGLSTSSLYRLIILPVIEGTFDPQILGYYTENHENLQKYFALFIQFLTEQGYGVVQQCASQFSHYREFYKAKLKIPRFIDAAATMSVAIDIIVEFGYYCGVDEKFYRQNAKLAVESIMTENLNSSKQSKPEIRFLYALTQSIGTSNNNGLAKNETEYVANTSSYIGFSEDEKKFIWLRFDDAYKTVVDYYKRQGEQFITTPKTIKELLLHKGISDGKLMSDRNKGNEYLRKSRKNPRKWFLVLKIDVVEKILDENKEEI